MKSLVLLASVVLLGGMIWGCGGGGGGSSPAPINANVVGQLSMPVAHELPKFEVYLDNDLDPVNGYVKKDSGVCQCQLLIDYMFVDVPAGNYYLYGIVRLNPNSKEGTAAMTDDFLGYYTGTGSATDPPAQVVVTANGKVDALINMKLN